MTDQLRDELQASLGRAYTIERELGGGGMSRVFVMREEAGNPADGGVTRAAQNRSVRIQAR